MSELNTTKGGYYGKEGCVKFIGRLNIWTILRPEMPLRRSLSKLSLKLGARHSQNVMAQLSAGIATRFPTVGELFQGRIVDIPRQTDPQSFDPNLKPEQSTDLSLLVRRRFGSGQITASFFFLDVKYAVFSFSGLNQFGTVVTSFKNIDLVSQSGLELIGEVRNLANPATQGMAFPRVPAWRASGNIRYKLSSTRQGLAGWRLPCFERRSLHQNIDQEIQKHFHLMRMTPRQRRDDIERRWDERDCW